MNWKLFASLFSVIFIAEFPDKTALAVLMMSAQGEPVPVFIGAALAFVLQSAVAIVFGKMISLFPEVWVHRLAGAMFIAFAAHIFFKKSEDEHVDEVKISHRKKWKAAWTAFTVIFIAEWGDLTQLATVSFVARYPTDLMTIFISSTLALWAATATMVFFGSQLKGRVSTLLLNRVSMVIYFLIGTYFIVNSFAESH